MPFRFLSYVAELLNNFVKDRDKSTLVGEVKDRLAQGFSRRDAIIRAVNFCLDNGIMGDYLVEHSEEVFHMLALEWNLDDAKQAWQEEAREQGELIRAEKIAVKRFVAQWSKHGYEKGEMQPFWLALLRDIFDLAEPEKFIRFEVPVKLKHTNFIDAFLPDAQSKEESVGISRQVGVAENL